MKGNGTNDFAYQAVYRYLMSLINEAEVHDQVKLPSLRQLAERLNVSISTIQYAYSLLEKEGRVYAVAKSGYFALPVTSGPVCQGGSDVLERLYVHSRRPKMLVLSGDEPAQLLSLDNPLLLTERELVRQYPRQSASQCQPFGELELRAVLASRYTTSARRYWHADDVYVGTDLRGVLETLVAALGLKNATVVVESPCDWVILRLLQANGVRVIELLMTADGRLDIPALEHVLKTEVVRLFLVSSAFSVPQGCQVPLKDRQRVAQLLERHDIWLLENDAQGELSFEQPALYWREVVNPDRLLVFSSFEKIMGVEACFGYLLSRHWRPELQRHFLLRAFRLSPIRQKAIARLYTSGRMDQHLMVLRRLLNERMHGMTQLLREHLSDHLEFVTPLGGATVWVNTRRSVDVRKVFERLLGHRLVIAPGELFSLNGHHHQCLRLSCSLTGSHTSELMVDGLTEALRREQVN